MESTSKDKLIEERFKTLKQRPDFEQRWAEEKEKRYHLLSIGQLVGKQFGWDLRKIEDWCFEQGFDGLEIRLQDSDFFKEIGQLNGLAKFKPRGILTVHLSDWAMWLDFYLQRQEALMKKFNTKENIIKYFGDNDPTVLVKRLAVELDLAKSLGARAATWHAMNIDYNEILFDEPAYADNEIIDIVQMLIAEIININQTSANLLSIENGSSVDRGIRRFAEYQRLFASKSLAGVGITFDTAHRAATLLQERDQTIPVDNLIAQELKDNPDLVSRIRLVHLSDTLPGSALKKSISQEQLEKANNDFWYKRVLVRDVVIDDHVPLGFVIKSGKKILDSISQNRQDKVIVVSELRHESFASLEKAIIIQKYNLCYD
ncbi:MAG: hypothetical protein PHH01_01320 [Patescibacteria group bacterium]|nr:hypothetical protein [Patescibacteria group bacterium]